MNDPALKTLLGLVLTFMVGFGVPFVWWWVRVDRADRAAIREINEDDAETVFERPKGKRR